MPGSKRASSLHLAPRFLPYSMLQSSMPSRYSYFFHSILMQFAEGGSLDDFIDGRLGKPAHNPLYSDNTPMDSEEDFRSRSDRIRTFKKKREMHSTERNELRKRRAERGRGQTAAIHLFSAEEIKSLFGDIVCGLGFLVSTVTAGALSFLNLSSIASPCFIWI
jgi:hypothetical protein